VAGEAALLDAIAGQLGESADGGTYDTLGDAMFSNKSDIHFRASCIASDRQSLIRR